MVTVRRLNTEELLDMLWEELPVLAEPGEREALPAALALSAPSAPGAPAQPFEMTQGPGPGPTFPEPFSRGRRRSR